MTRARLQWLKEGEKPSSFFCKLEKQHFTEKTIRKIETNTGDIITDQKVILNNVEKFYHNLFRSRDNKDHNYNMKEEIRNAKLKTIPKVQLGSPILVSELGAVLKKMKNNKSPGIDGFFKVILGEIKILYC